MMNSSLEQQNLQRTPLSEKLATEETLDRQGFRDIFYQLIKKLGLEDENVSPDDTNFLKLLKPLGVNSLPKQEVQDLRENLIQTLPNEQESNLAKWNIEKFDIFKPLSNLIKQIGGRKTVTLTHAAGEISFHILERTITKTQNPDALKILYKIYSAWKAGPGTEKDGKYLKYNSKMEQVLREFSEETNKLPLETSTVSITDKNTPHLNPLLKFDMTNTLPSLVRVGVNAEVPANYSKDFEIKIQPAIRKFSSAISATLVSPGETPSKKIDSNHPEKGNNPIFVGVRLEGDGKPLQEIVKHQQEAFRNAAITLLNACSSARETIDPEKTWPMSIVVPEPTNIPSE